MSNGQRSTTLKMVEKYCPAALDFYDANTPYNRDVFSVGIAAHGILEGLQRAKRDRNNSVMFGAAEAVADAVSTRLVTAGRSFDGVPEPPLSPRAVGEGRDIALKWWNRISDSAPVPMDWRPEEALAVDRDWQPVKYGRDAYYRCILDLVGPVTVEVDEDGYGGGVGIAVTDYKSAWGTNESELDTVQLRGQALVALANAGHLGVVAPAFIRRRVVNLRTHREYEADTYLGDDGADEILESWRKDIALAIAHANARGADQKRAASPGACCVGCPYIMACKPAQAFYRGQGIEDPTPEGIATSYAVATAVREHLTPLVKEATGNGNIVVPGGSVGFVAQPKRKALPTIAETLALRWFRPPDAQQWIAENGHLMGFLAALSLGSAAVDKIGLRLFPGKGPNKRADFKDARAELVDATLTVENTDKFGVHRQKEEPAETEAQALAKLSDVPFDID